MLLARLQTSENEQTKAYVRATVFNRNGGASRNSRNKKLSGDSFCRECQGAATPMYPVLAAAAGIKLESTDQHRLTARVKRSRAPFGADQPIKN